MRLQGLTVGVIITEKTQEGGEIVFVLKDKQCLCLVLVWFAEDLFAQSLLFI
jgi:hypothetical protein